MAAASSLRGYFRWCKTISFLVQPVKLTQCSIMTVEFSISSQQSKTDETSQCTQLSDETHFDCTFCLRFTKSASRILMTSSTSWTDSHCRNVKQRLYQLTKLRQTFKTRKLKNQERQNDSILRWRKAKMPTTVDKYIVRDETCYTEKGAAGHGLR